MSIDNSQVEVIINSIINMNEKMHIMEKRFQTKVESLEKENRHLYKQIEVLTEINTRNEMEKEDKKSVINRLLSRVKTNITKLFENFVVVENKIKTIDTNIDICFENFKRNDIDREEMFEYDETNDQEIKANIKLLFEKDKINEKKIRKLFNNCELYKKQIEILFDNDNDN